jgi:hypothetical protein
MKTSDTVTQLALYSSACCGEDALFDRKDTFSRCPACKSLCFWQLDEPVVSWLDMDNAADEQLLKAA